MFATFIALLVALWVLPLPAFAPDAFFRAEDEPKSVEIIFGGDMMFDRSVRQAMEKEGDDFVFSCIAETLRDADLVVANLEGPVTSHPSKSIGTGPGNAYNVTFTFPTSTATLLLRHNIKLVNLGNNHIMNFSREGLLQTKDWLDEAGVKYFGDPDSVEEDRVARLDIEGIPFSFVNWSDWTSDKTDHTVQQVRKEAEKGRMTIVYTHWGDEYVPPSPQMRQLAHSFIDAGAEIVIGSHPHVVLEHEKYNEKDIYYSLGNFIFDQYFNENVRNGLLLKISFTKEGIGGITEIPIYLEKDRRTCLKEVE